jgi:hypothetical protein
MNNGTQLITYQTTGWSDQNWTNQNYSTGSSDYQMWSAGSAAPGGPPPTNTWSRCLALPNGNTNVGTQLIIWDCTYHTTDQAWTPSFQFNNADNASCYAFVNTKAAPLGTRVFGVSSNPVNGTAVVLVTWTADPKQVWCAYNPDGSPQQLQ